MIKFNEYIPKGGYAAYNRRRKLTNKIKTFTMVLVGFCMYAAACTICAEI